MSVTWSVPAPHRQRAETRCRVAILGCGTVGLAVARRLAGNAMRGLELAHILDRRADEKRAIARAERGALADPAITWTTRVDDILASDVDIIVELIGGLEPAAAWIRSALLAGKSVVTANKQVIAVHGPALLDLASRQGRQLRFEAAVGGAMPIVRALGDSLAGDCITKITAILNGTCNAVLTEVEATGCSVGHAVTAASARGLAEANPSSDLDGDDACAKLAILCGLAFGVRVEASAIDARSISQVQPFDFETARRHDATIRQIAFAEYDPARRALTAWVAPALVPRSSVFARATGPQNAAVLTGRYAGDVVLSGAGAGGDATAVSVISDLLIVARDPSAIVHAPSLEPPALVAGLPRSTYIVDTPERAAWRDPRRSDSRSQTEVAGPHARPAYAEAV